MRIKLHLIGFLSTALFLFSCGGGATRENELSEDYQRIESYYKSGDFNRCIKEAEAFVKEYPEHSYGWGLLSGACIALRNDSMSELGLQYANKAILLDSTNYVAIINKAILFDKLSRYSEARLLYEKAIEINPTYPQAYSNYAGNRIREKDYKSAIANGEKAVALANQLAVLCYAYHLAGEYDQRDSLIVILNKEGYPNIKQLQQSFN